MDLGMFNCKLCSVWEIPLRTEAQPGMLAAAADGEIFSASATKGREPQASCPHAAPLLPDLSPGAQRQWKPSLAAADPPPAHAQAASQKAQPKRLPLQLKSNMLNRGWGGGGDAMYITSKSPETKAGIIQAILARKQCHTTEPSASAFCSLLR